MAKLEKINPNDIIDTLHITEVSEETGEAVTYTKAVYSPEGQSKLDENKQIKLSEKELHVYLKEEYGNFFFYFYNVLDTYDIKPQYKVRFLYLASYLDFNNDLLVAKDEYGLKIQLNKPLMRDILKLKDTEFKSTLKTLIDSGLMIKDGSHYKINTVCSIKGNAPNTKQLYTRLFIKSIRELYDMCDAKNHKQLYYIFKILPYVNLQFNMVCHKTDCDIMKNIEPINITDLCRLIGYKETNSTRLWNTIRGFKIGEDYVVCKHSVDKQEFITINPRIYYAGTRIENISYLTSIFDMAK